MYNEAPPNEKREFVKVSKDQPYIKGDYLKSNYKPVDDYFGWVERRRKQGKWTPDPHY
jgi:hypothetical protein